MLGGLRGLWHSSEIGPKFSANGRASVSKHKVADVFGRFLEIYLLDLIHSTVGNTSGITWTQLLEFMTEMVIVLV